MQKAKSIGNYTEDPYFSLFQGAHDFYLVGLKRDIKMTIISRLGRTAKRLDIQRAQLA